MDRDEQTMDMKDWQCMDQHVATLLRLSGLLPKTLEIGPLLAEAKRIEKTLGDGLRGLAAKYPVIGEVRGKGAMLAIEFVDPATNEPNAQAVTDVINAAAQKGVLLLNAGASYNVIRFLPSVKTSDALLNEVIEVLDECIGAL